MDVGQSAPSPACESEPLRALRHSPIHLAWVPIDFLKHRLPLSRSSPPTPVSSSPLGSRSMPTRLGDPWTWSGSTPAPTSYAVAAAAHRWQRRLPRPWPMAPHQPWPASPRPARPWWRCRVLGCTSASLAGFACWSWTLASCETEKAGVQHTTTSCTWAGDFLVQNLAPAHTLVPGLETMRTTIWNGGSTC